MEDFGRDTRRGVGAVEHDELHRADIEHTLAAYDLIVNNDGGDLKKPYGQFSDGLKSLEEEEARQERLREAEADE